MQHTGDDIIAALVNREPVLRVDTWQRLGTARRAVPTECRPGVPGPGQLDGFTGYRAG
jgi:hypothetical protein